MPAMSAWSSGMTPQPMSVGMTGTPSVSASSTSRSSPPALTIPPPATSRGRSAASSRSIAFSAWARVAVGRCTGSGS